MIVYLFSCPFAGPAVQRGDNVIQWINPHRADKMYSDQLIHFIGWIATYPLDKLVHPLNINPGSFICMKTSCVDLSLGIQTPVVQRVHINFIQQIFNLLVGVFIHRIDYIRFLNKRCLIYR